VRLPVSSEIHYIRREIDIRAASVPPPPSEKPPGHPGTAPRSNGAYPPNQQKNDNKSYADHEA